MYVWSGIGLGFNRATVMLALAFLDSLGFPQVVANISQYEHRFYFVSLVALLLQLSNSEYSHKASV